MAVRNDESSIGSGEPGQDLLEVALAEKDAEEKPTPKGPLEFAEDQRSRFAAALDKIRNRTDATAKTFGALAAAGLTAVGLTKAPDLFPLPDREWAIFVLGVVVAGFVALAAAAGIIFRQLWQINSPIFTSSNLTKMADELKATGPNRTPEGEKEYELLAEVYKQTADLNRRASDPSTFDLEAYERKALNAQDSADSPNATKADKERFTQEASIIRAEVLATQARASALIGRTRSARIVTSTPTIRAVIMFIAGLIAFAGASDLLASERPDTLTAFVKNCADAQKALKDAGLTTIDKLPDACRGDSTGGGGGSPLTARQQTSAALVTLSSQWQDCVARTKLEAQQAVCGPTFALLQAAALQVGQQSYPVPVG